jgi:hypothetical protein
MHTKSERRDAERFYNVSLHSLDGDDLSGADQTVVSFRVKPQAQLPAKYQSCKIYVRSFLTDEAVPTTAFKIYINRDLPNNVTSATASSRSGLIATVPNAVQGNAAQAVFGAVMPGSASANGRLLNHHLIDGSPFEIRISDAGDGTVQFGAATTYTLELEIELLDNGEC